MLLLLPSALFKLDLLLFLLWLLFVANNFFDSPSFLAAESAVAFRCMNLMPIVALDNFLEEDDPPLFFGLIACSLEFGVVVLALGLAVPGFHIMIG